MTPYMDLEAVVLEYLSPDSGSLEIKLPSGGTMSCYFHAESVWIINRWGNPYGLPVPFVEPNGAPRDSLPLELPLGSLVNIRYCPGLVTDTILLTFQNQGLM